MHNHRPLTSPRLQRHTGTVVIIAKLHWVGTGWLGGTGREDECGVRSVQGQLKRRELFHKRMKRPFELMGQDQRGGQLKGSLWWETTTDYPVGKRRWMKPISETQETTGLTTVSQRLWSKSS